MQIYTILIVDDDAEICDAITSAVERMGHRATSVHTLEAGLTKLRNGAFDVVLLDVKLPDGDGLQALHDIQLLFESMAIEFAFPTQTLHLKTETPFEGQDKQGSVPVVLPERDEMKPPK